MKIKNTWNYKILILILLLTLNFNISHSGYSQGKYGVIKLLKKETLSPYIDVHFVYGTQTGVSDNEGIIRLNFTPSWILNLSHVEFGKMDLGPQQVETAISQGELIIESPEPVMLQPVTVMSMRASQLNKDLQSLSDYDRLSHDAGSYLSRSPSLAVIRKSGNYGFDPVFRGFKYEQLNLIVDGTQTALAACPNRMDPPASQISLNQMEKVEILKGPHFLRYGSSVGGTINFVSSQPGYSDIPEPLGRLSSSFEANGDIFRSEGVFGFRNQNYMVTINGSWSTGNDYSDGDKVIIPSGFTRGSFGTNLRFRIDPFQNLSLNITRNLARDVVFAALPMDLQKDDTWLVNLKHELEVSGGHMTRWVTTAYFSHVGHMMDNLDKNLESRMANATTNATTISHGGRTEATFLYPSSSAFVGADVRIEEAEGSRTREMLMGPMTGTTLVDNAWQDSRILKTGIFGELRIDRGSLDYIFSGRMDINRASINDVSEEFSTIYNTDATIQINPGASVGIKSQLTRTLDIGFWIGRAARSGSLSERFINYFPVGLDPYEMVGSPLLDPEINNQIDLNFEFSNRGLELKLNMFGSLVQDYISSVIRDDLNPRLSASPGVRQYVNIGEAVLSGFEIGWSQFLFRHLNFKIDMVYTYGEDLERNEPLPEIAPLEVQAAIAGHFLDYSLRPEITLRLVNDQNRISGIYGETETPGFSTVNIKTTYDISNNFHVAAGINNLFDIAYYEHLSRSVRDSSLRPIYAPGRNVFLTLSMDFMN